MMTKRIFSALLAAALSLSLLAGCGSTSGSTASSAAVVVFLFFRCQLQVLVQVLATVIEERASFRNSLCQSGSLISA